jgi:hypothetical protein
MNNENLKRKRELALQNLPIRSPARIVSEADRADEYIESCLPSINLINEILAKPIKSPIDLDQLKRNALHLELTLSRECIAGCPHSLEDIQSALSSAKAYLESV